MYFILGAIALVVIIIALLYKGSKEAKYGMQYLLMHIPVVKDIIIYNQLVTFTGTFATLIRHDVFITDSMDILSKITDNEIYKRIEEILNKDNQIKERETRARGEVPASAGDVAAFVLDNNLDVDPDAFWNYYEANGWVTKAGTPVRNWKALCRTWNGKPQYNTTKTDAPADPDGLTPEMRASVERVKERRRNEHR